MRKTVAYWKRKYNLTSNDPRYLTATYTQILEDVAEDTFYAHMKEFTAYDSETNEKIKQQEIDPEFAKKEAQAAADSIREFLGN